MAGWMVGYRMTIFKTHQWTICETGGLLSNLQLTTRHNYRQTTMRSFTRQHFAAIVIKMLIILSAGGGDKHGKRAVYVGFII